MSGRVKRVETTHGKQVEKTRQEGLSSKDLQSLSISQTPSPPLETTNSNANSQKTFTNKHLEATPFIPKKNTTTSDTDSQTVSQKTITTQHLSAVPFVSKKTTDIPNNPSPPKQSQNIEEHDSDLIYMYSDVYQEQIEEEITENTIFSDYDLEDMRRMDIAEAYLAGDMDNKTYRCECCHDNPYNCPNTECSIRQVCDCSIQEDYDAALLDEWSPSSAQCMCCHGFTYACNHLQNGCKIGYPSRCVCVANKAPVTF